MDVPPDAGSQAAGAVEMFEPGVISSEDEEYRIVFTADDRTAYFGRAREFFPRSRQATIMVSRRDAAGWSEPAPASFSGRFSDIDPFISPDGSRLFFSSIRPVDGRPRDDIELWMVERTATGWSDPVHLSGVGSEYDELYPSVDADGDLYFGSDRPHAAGAPRAWNIWRARVIPGGYAEPEILGSAVNSEEVWEFNPTISADGRRLVFTRLDLRDQRGTGMGEIMVTWLRNGDWTVARPVGPPVNTPVDEYHPSFSGNGEWLYFMRRDPLAPGARGNIHRVRVTAVAGLRSSGSTDAP